MVSSLQTAAAAEQVKTGQGQFENCFSSGLDLSEFDDANASVERTTTTTASIAHHQSAAQALLLVKAKEKQKLQDQFAEDAKLEDLIVKRQQEAQALAATSNKAGNGGQDDDGMVRVPRPASTDSSATLSLQRGALVVDVLVGMHSTDTKDERFQNNKAKQKQRLLLAKKTQRHKHSKRK